MRNIIRITLHSSRQPNISLTLLTSASATARWTRRRFLSICLACAVAATLAPFRQCYADDVAHAWSRFRGPNGQGRSSVVGPAKIDLTTLAWKMPVPAGRSSAVLAGDRILLTGVEDGSLLTVCLDRRSGREMWRREAPRPRREKHHPKGGPAASTPATDEENVYVFFPDFGLIAYGLEGDERWRLALGPFNLPNGHSSSPVLAGGLLILQVDQDQGAYLLALNPKDGNERWRTQRPEAAHGYSTPAVFSPLGAPEQLVLTGSNHVASYALATGEKMWWSRGLTWQAKPSAAVSTDTVFVTGWAPGADAGERMELPPFAEAIQRGDADKDGKISEEETKANGWRHRGGWGLIDLDDDGLLDDRDWQFFRARRAAHNRTLAIRPQTDARGDITDAAWLWSYEKAVPVVASPLLHEGILYTLKDGGILTAFEAGTGKVLKQGRVEGAIDQYYASPVCAGARMYLASENGKIALVKAGADWAVLSVTDLAEECYATPALGEGALCVRTLSHVWVFGR